MSIEKHMRRIGCSAFVMGDHHWVSGCIAHAGIETDRFQVCHQPFRSFAAVSLVGRVGRNRLDPQEIEKAVEAPVEIGVEMVENIVERWFGHGCFLTSRNVNWRHSTTSLVKKKPNLREAYLPENELAAVVRGLPQRPYHYTQSGSPERGMRLPLTSGIQRGTGQKTGDRRTVDELRFGFQLWLFKGTEDYKSVTNVLSWSDHFSFVDGCSS